MGKRWGLLALAGATGAVGALALREGLQRRSDRADFEAGRDFWRAASTPEDIHWVEAHLATYHIPSDGVGVHLDVYAQGDRAAPVVILVHGLMTYGRVFVPLARAFYERGYTVIATDIVGNGFSGGVRGDSPVGAAATGVVRSAIWARERFDGPLYLMGLSLGGAVAYAAAAAGAPISALACLDLFTFNDRAALRRLVAQPRLVALLPLLRAVAVPFGWVRFPTRWLSTLEGALAPNEATTAGIWQFDPLLARHMTLRTLVSAAFTPPHVPLERNVVPTLVLNQGRDTVLDPAVTRAAYARLGGPKRYVELADSPHWSFTPTFAARLATECDAWFTTHNMQATTLHPAVSQPA